MSQERVYFLNDFHRESTVRCMEAIKQMQLTPCSHESLKAQCQRWKEDAQKKDEVTKSI